MESRECGLCRRRGLDVARLLSLAGEQATWVCHPCIHKAMRLRSDVVDRPRVRRLHGVAADTGDELWRTEHAVYLFPAGLLREVSRPFLALRSRDAW